MEPFSSSSSFKQDFNRGSNMQSSQMPTSSSHSDRQSGRNTPGPTAASTATTAPSYSADLFGSSNFANPDLDAFAAVFPEDLTGFDTTNGLVPPSELDWLLPLHQDQLTQAPGPNPDQFDIDLEQALAGIEPSQLNTLNNLTVDFTQQQFFVHRGTISSLSHPGPLSSITVSSESAYDDNRSESYYNPYSPQGSLVNAANPAAFNPAVYQALEEFSLDLATFGLSDPTPQSSVNTNLLTLNNTVTPSSVNLDLLMPSSTTSTQSRSSFDELSSVSIPGQSPIGLYVGDDNGDIEREFGTSTRLISPTTYPQVQPQSVTDPRKKYQCPNCPRAFARAFNLKTHMATHDPNRLKPHICHHPNCGRSFSRKHDLGRHLVSIHKDESGLKMTNGVGSSASSTIGVSGHPLPHVNAHAHPGRIHQVGDTPNQKGSTTPTSATASSFLPNIALGGYSQLGSGFIKDQKSNLAGKNGVGVAANGVARGWCDTCGQGWVGQRRNCNCSGEFDSKIKR